MAAQVRLASKGDRAVVAGALARAFADDPLMVWLVPDEGERRRRLPRFFARLFADCDAGCMRWITDGGEAATLWHGPDEKSRTGRAAYWLDMARWWQVAGPHLPRFVVLGEQINRTRLAEPHWYLGIAGCDPSAQGSGLGGAVIRAGLDRVDADGLPACLETAREANLSLYRRFGFEVTDEWRLPDGPPVWSMVRATS